MALFIHRFCDNTTHSGHWSPDQAIKCGVPSCNVLKTLPHADSPPPPLQQSQRGSVSRESIYCIASLFTWEKGGETLWLIHTVSLPPSHSVQTTHLIRAYALQ